eukprot:scaffold857_cov152-Ochromonas_danica.AAC.14
MRSGNVCGLSTLRVRRRGQRKERIEKTPDGDRFKNCSFSNLPPSKSNRRARPGSLTWYRWDELRERSRRAAKLLSGSAESSEAWRSFSRGGLLD